MKPVLVLAACAAAFLFLLVSPHRRAATLVRSEEAARERIRTLGRGAAGEAIREGGYLFRWITGNDWRPLLVAEPERPGEDGVRTFATPDGEVVFERDPITYRPALPDPAESRLRRYLSAPPSERRSRDMPPDWRPSTP